jgi:nucleoid DNA-binding protein
LSRRKLIKQLKEKNSHLNQSEIEAVINIFSESISKALNNGNSVEIRGLGRFFIKKLKENFYASKSIKNKKN